MEVRLGEIDLGKMLDSAHVLILVLVEVRLGEPKERHPIIFGES